MKKLTLNDPETKSPDLVAENIERLKALFPELVTEGPNGASVNVDVLKQLVGDQTVTDAEEKYGLNWFGKRRARQLALTPSTGTLRPCPEDSVDWDTTQNLVIEGDNLEVLKLLQKSYAGKVKLIYIDPPYNTGKDFVYKDDFRDNIRNYKRLTGQVDDEGSPLTSNPETSGRFHTDWLNMMYSRLKMARNLLSPGGLLFSSIDETEYPNLRKILDEIFGEENHIADFVWHNKTGGGNDSKHVAIEHEYIVLYSRDKGSTEALFHTYNPAYIARYKEKDSKGRFYWDTFKRKSGKQYYPIECPDGTVLEFDEHGNKISWLRSKERFYSDMQNGEIRFVKKENGWSVQFKQRLPKGKKPRTISGIDSFLTGKGKTSDGSQDILDLFNAPVFDNPKPCDLISYLLSFACKESGVVLDFFAGSGTTGHAVMAQNAADGGKRRYILVQLPEPLDPENKKQEVAAEFCDKLGKPRTIAELTKERLRRARKKIKEEHPDWNGDTGFRVFKLDSSNIKAWNPHTDDLEGDLVDQIDHILPDRTETDLLYELLLKLGLDLCVPIETRTIAGKEVHSVGGGVLMSCLAETIRQDDVEALALGIVDWHKELAPASDTTCVFRDSAFADDVAKTNMAAILEQHGIANVRSL